MKRSDFSNIIEAKGVRGCILGFAEDRFFRADKLVAGHEDFKFRTCDISVELLDNVLCIPKDTSKSPFLDIPAFEDDPSTVMELPSGIAVRFKDPKNILIPTRFYLQADLYDRISRKAEKEGLDVHAYVKKLVEADASRT